MGNICIFIEWDHVWTSSLQISWNGNQSRWRTDRLTLHAVAAATATAEGHVQDTMRSYASSCNQVTMRWLTPSLGQTHSSATTIRWIITAIKAIGHYLSIWEPLWHRPPSPILEMPELCSRWKRRNRRYSTWTNLFLSLDPLPSTHHIKGIFQD